MTKEARPNLGGLFNGTTPPERSSRLTEAVGAAKPGPGAGGPPAAPTPSGTDSPRPTDRWIDPVRAVERYFEVLQAVLDVNRRFAVGVAGVVGSVSQRLLSHR